MGCEFEKNEEPNDHARFQYWDDKYISVDRSKIRFDLSRSTLLRWQKEFGLPVSHVRGRTFFRVADIQIVIERGFNSPPL
jgi:hypothetical protein